MFAYLEMRLSQSSRWWVVLARSEHGGDDYTRGEILETSPSPIEAIKYRAGVRDVLLTFLAHVEDRTVLGRAKDVLNRANMVRIYLSKLEVIKFLT